METVTDFIFLGSKITADGDCSHKIKRHLLLGIKAMTNLESILKNREICCQQTFANKGPYSQSYGFSSSHIQMWELDHKEVRAPKNWCFQTVVLEKTFVFSMRRQIHVHESPMDSKDIKPVNPKENQPWIFSGRTDAEAPILWPPDTKRWVIGKDPDAGKDWGQKEKEMMV